MGREKESSAQLRTRIRELKLQVGPIPIRKDNVLKPRPGARKKLAEEDLLKIIARTDDNAHVNSRIYLK
ncbi:hypothetical protein N7510_000239 [Penicillium lagena]|uniref:uncharacterized protein n=1 Tax=Penicillium lagena TaxID=94218 RepID=UPI002540C876|nr:uncharacterized protein N7510_000239 [Penicillium lagena]KAJ5623930.1 hypothetical protein N7510_000239 [Penicillium lagena]